MTCWNVGNVGSGRNMMVTGDVVDLDSRVKLIDFGAGRPRLFSCFSDAYPITFIQFFDPYLH